MYTYVYILRIPKVPKDNRDVVAYGHVCAAVFVVTWKCCFTVTK